MCTFPREAVLAAQRRLRLKREGTRAGTRASLPADLAAFVLFFEPAHQRFEVFRRRASGDVFAGRFLQYFVPIFILEASKRWLDQVAISGPGLRMFIGEPQKHKADNRH